MSCRTVAAGLDAGSHVVAIAFAGAAAVALTAAGPAAAVPLWPGGPEVPSVEDVIRSVVPQGPGAPQLPPQLLPEQPAPFSAPSLNPSNGETVGVAQPIIIRFNEAIGDRAAAERAIRVTTASSGRRPFLLASRQPGALEAVQFWPANTSVTVDGR